MRCTRSTILTLVIVAAGGARAAAQEPARPLSVEEAVRLAVEGNERVEEAVAGVDQSRGAVTETMARALPKLDFSYQYGWNIQRPVIFFNQGGTVEQVSIGRDNDNTFSLDLSQSIFDASLGSALRAARSARDFSEANLETTRRAVALSARTAYYGVLLDSQLVQVQEQALAQAQARLDDINERARAGLAAEFDVLTAQVAVENIRPQLIRARNQLSLSRITLNRTLGLPLAVPVQLTDSLAYQPPPTMEAEAVGRILGLRSDIVGAEQLVAMRKAAAGAERGNRLPTMELNLGLQRRASSADVVPESPDFSQSLIAGVRLEWPVFDGRATAGRLLQLEAARRTDEARLTGLRRDVQLEFQQADQSLRAAEAEVLSSRATVGLAERALAIAQTRFRAGLSTQLELGDAELALTEARTNISEALYRFNVAQAEWRAALGER